MNYSFIKKHKILTFLFVLGVLAIIGGITIYQINAIPPGWTQTSWNDGQSSDFITVNNELELLGTTYLEASPYIDFSIPGQIGVKNIINNPDFETDISNWIYDPTLASHETTNIHSGSGSVKIETLDSPISFHQNIQIESNDNNNYYLSAYVKNDTIGDDGLVDDDVICLFYNDDISTEYIDLGDGWYRIYSTDPIVDDGSDLKSYGIVINKNKTIYLDDFELFAENNVLSSNFFYMGQAKVWSQLYYTLSGTGTTIVKARTGDETIDAKNFDSPLCTHITSGSRLSENQCVFDGDAYIQYQIQFNATDNPPTFQTLKNITIHAYPSIIEFDTSVANGKEDLIDSISVNVSLNYALERDASVDYTITGTADNGIDYDLLGSPKTITIPAGETSAQIEITGIVPDTLYEDDETIIITLSNPTFTSLGEKNVYTYTIINDDPLPFVKWGSEFYALEENQGNFSLEAIVIDENGNPITYGKDIIIPITIEGTATRNEDYTVLEAEDIITIPAGSSSAFFNINIIDDLAYEGNIRETIIIIMNTPNNAALSEIYQSTINIADNDPAPSVAFTLVESSGIENNGDSINIEISLDGQTNLDAQVDFHVIGGTATGDGEDYTLINSWVTIPAGETTANIAFSVHDDFLIEGDETIIIEIDNPVYCTLGANTVHTYTIIDDDVPGISTTLFTINDYTSEWGDYQKFEININTQPNGAVVIKVESSDTNEGTVNPETLTFTPDNWNTQTITITGVDDKIADGDKPYHISLTIDPLNTTDSSGYATLAPTLIATINLDDDVAGVIVTPTELTTYEYGGEQTFTVVLSSEPITQVGILLESSNTDEGIINKDSLKFTSLNWDIPQEVTITPQNDVIQDGPQEYHIIITVNDNILLPPYTNDPQYLLIDPEDVVVINMDDDTPGIHVSDISENTSEAGATATFTVVLESPPSDDVTIALNSSNIAEGTINPENLTFTSGNWNVAQIITITGVDDNIDDGDQSFEITGIISSDDLNYNGMIFPSLPVINENDDTAGIDLSLISGNTNEDGASAIFTIVLTSEPLNDVEFSISSSNTDEGIVNPENIIFTPDNWNIAQTITVTGVDDYIVDGNISYEINIGPTNSLDPKYDNHFTATVELQNIDNDSIGFTITQSAGSTNVTEGGTTDTYSIRLNTIPSDDVIVTIIPNEQITVNPTILTFTDANWNIKQIITVRAVDDTIIEGNHTGIISHSVSSDDSDYNLFEIDNILVAITDNDSPPRTSGGGSGFWFPSHNSHNPDETQLPTKQPQSDPQREQRLKNLQNLGISVHGLVKIPDDNNPNTTFDNIVYYIGTDGMRHAFPNATIYKTWYDSFRYVQIYPMETLSQIPLGDNVRYKPGVKMIKFTSSNKVYAIETGGKLRWILNEKVAGYMYGQGWQKHIVNLPDSLFPGYEFGDDISHSDQFDFATETALSQNISMDLGL